MGAARRIPASGDSRQSIAGPEHGPGTPGATHPGWFRLRTLKRHVDGSRWRDMRVVLEWLGLVEPDRSRREPVAVPGWAPVAVAATAAFLTGIAAFIAWALLRAILV